MIYVIIPVYNRKHYTRACLQCLEEQTYRNFTTVVVDDGSTDGTSEMIAAEFPGVIVLHGDGNLWWTKAINMGVRYALEHNCSFSIVQQDSDVNAVLTLNDDLLVGCDYLATIIADFQANQPCLMGSVVVDVKNIDYLEYAGTSCNYITAKSNRTAAKFNNNYHSLKAAHKTLPTDDLSGRGTLIPLQVFEKIGLYDERNFPHYMADIEMSVRARRAGFPLLISVRSVIKNYMEATRNKRTTWDKFFKGFFAFESPNYLRMRYEFALRYSPIKHIYFLLDVSRITLSFALKR